MEDKLSVSKIKINFIKRVLSAFVIMPVMILPIFLSGYILIFFYLLFLTFIVDELFRIIENSSYKICLYLYFLITLFSFITFIILLISSNDKELFILIIFIIWIFDTFSYLGGTIIKGKKLFPKISKGKTYSGLFTGLLASTAIYFLATYYFNLTYLISYNSVLAIIVLAFVGDIIVSLLKRSASMKDTSNAIPGHGGFLDRFDSFIFVFFSVGIFYLLLI